MSGGPLHPQHDTAKDGLRLASTPRVNRQSSRGRPGGAPWFHHDPKKIRWVGVFTIAGLLAWGIWWFGPWGPESDWLGGWMWAAIVGLGVLLSIPFFRLPQGWSGLWTTNVILAGDQVESLIRTAFTRAGYSPAVRVVPPQTRLRYFRDCRDPIELPELRARLWLRVSRGLSRNPSGTQVTRIMVEPIPAGTDVLAVRTAVDAALAETGANRWAPLSAVGGR